MTVLPIGTRVTIASVDHLIKPGKRRGSIGRLIGRLGVVGDHEGDLNIVTGLGLVVRGYPVFPDDALTVVGPGPAPTMPGRYRVRGYTIPDSSQGDGR